MATRPCFTDPVDLSNRVDAYFKRCEDSRREWTLKNGDIRVRQETPSLTGLCVHLGCSMDTLNSYMRMEDKSKQIPDREIYRNISEVLTRARDRCAEALIRRATDGDCDSRTATLLLGAYGVVQKVEVAASTTVTIEGASRADVDDWSG